MVSLGLLVLRVVIGGIFAIHGYPKIFGGPGKGKDVPPEVTNLLGEGFAQSMDNGGIQNTANFLQGIDIPYPQMAAIALAATELGGGLALILGWQTRLAALALTFSQLVAVEKVHGKQGLVAPGGYERNAALTAATVCLALAGPGAIALD